MAPGTRKQQKPKISAKKSRKEPKSDMLMSEDMEQGLLSQHHHRGNSPGEKKADLYRKKIKRTSDE